VTGLERAVDWLYRHQITFFFVAAATAAAVLTCWGL
jgi:hypothetical protein